MKNIPRAKRLRLNRMSVYMLDAIFKESLKLAGQLRPNYPQSLGNKADNWENIIGKLNANIPEIFSAISS